MRSTPVDPAFSRIEVQGSVLLHSLEPQMSRWNILVSYREQMKAKCKDHFKKMKRLFDLECFSIFDPSLIL